MRHPESAIRQSTPVGNSAHANPFANGGHYYTPVSYRESVGRTLGHKASEAADDHTRAVLEAFFAQHGEMSGGLATAAIRDDLR